jgi:phage terminase large subunit-like protein
MAGKVTRVKGAPYKVFSLDHFRAYAERIVLDTGEPWEVEDFQLEIFEPILAGVREVWAVVPETNTKTTMMAGYALYHADFTWAPWVPIAASSRDQAEIMARQAYQMIRSSPLLRGRFKIYEGYREIRSLHNGGRGIKVYAADTTTGDGVIPTLALCDEGHRWPDLALYRLWKGKLNKRGGQIVMISTAGEPGGEFEEARDHIRNWASKRRRDRGHTYSEGPNIVMNEWSVGDPAKVTDMAAVKEANPFSGITEEKLLEEFNSPTTDLGDWRRLKCNVPSRNTQAAITEPEWDRARTDKAIPEGEHLDCGVDVAWKHDTFAIVPLWINREEEYRLLGDPKVLTPPRDGSTMHPDEAKRAFEEIYDRNPIDAVAIDIERAEDVAAWLEDEWDILIIDRPQGNANAVEDYDAFMKGLRNGTLKHTGSPVLRQHVMNAVARRLPGDKLRFDRPSSSRAKRKQVVRVIDALTAAGMVNHYQDNFQVNEPLVAWGT